MRIHVHTGILSADNGATAPLKQFSDLAALLGAQKTWGQHYGQDFMDVPEDMVPMATELLNEGKMLYRFADDEVVWRNVQTEKVARALHLSRAEFLPAATAA